MGYFDYIRAQLRPLRLYDLDTGAGAEELRSAGAALDALSEALEALEQDSCALTATDAGLTELETLLPYAPVSADTAARREAVAALLRIDGAGFTPEALRRTISGCGIQASIRESETPFTVEISFPGVMGEPENFAALCLRIEQILPCHLDVRYVLRYFTWQELEAEFASWSALEAAAQTWDALEKYTAA